MTDSTHKVSITELKSEAGLRAALPVLQVLWPNLDYESLADAMGSMTAKGYTLFGLWSGTEIVCVAGVQEIQLLAIGKILWLFDMATLRPQQGKGYGSRLLEFVKQYANDQGYSRLLLHTSGEREDTIKFYESHLGDAFGVVFRAVIGPREL